MKTIYLGPLPKITLWMRIKRVWCKHKNTFTQSYAHKDDQQIKFSVPTYWQCHDCGVSWGTYDLDKNVTISSKDN